MATKYYNYIFIKGFLAFQRLFFIIQIFCGRQFHEIMFPLSDKRGQGA